MASPPQPYNTGPGPNAYILPPLTGYPKHDISKWRNPAYSMGIRHASFSQKGGPGPYNLDKYTRFGKAYIPAAPFGMRHPDHDQTVGPGPGAYNLNVPRKVKAGECTFGVRSDPHAKATGPGPNAYVVNDKNLKRPPAYPMGMRTEIVSKHVGPGPNAYNPKIKDNIPTVKFGNPPCPPSGRTTGPGPGAHQGPEFLAYNKKGNPPKFAFGVKTTNTPYISPEDNAECELICRRQ